MEQAKLDDLQYVKHVVGLKTYEGWAKPGTQLTSRAWRIKLTENSENPYAFPQPETYESSVKFPVAGNQLSEKNGVPFNGFKFAWSEHESLQYSFEKDTTAPTLTTVTIASDNSDTTKAVEGDTVTLTVVASEYLSEISATIGGTAATVIQGADAKNWTISRVMTGSDTAGALAFAIDFEDIAGRSGTQVSETTDESSVTFTVPSPEYVGIVNSAYPQLPPFLDVSAIGNPLPNNMAVSYDPADVAVDSVEVTAEAGLEITNVQVASDYSVTFTAVTFAGGQYDVTIRATGAAGGTTETVVMLENL